MDLPHSEKEYGASTDDTPPVLHSPSERAMHPTMVDRNRSVKFSFYISHIAISD